MEREDRERFLTEIWPAAEQAARARGLSDEEIAEKRRQLLDLLDRAPDGREPDWGGLEAIAHGTARPPDRLPRSLFGGGPILRLAFHPILMRLVVILVCALLGSAGMPTKHGGRLWDPGASGALYGAAFGVCVLAFAQLLLYVQRRRAG